MSVVSANCYELLGVPVHAPRADVARAWRDRRREALQGSPQRSAEEVEALCARLDEAFRTLVDPRRSALYQAYIAQERQPPALEPGPDPLRTPLARPWQNPQEQLAEKIDAVLETGSHELPDEDTINTLDEWGTPDGERSTTQPSGRAARPALPMARPPSAPQAVTGRHRVTARSRKTVANGTVPPWKTRD